MANLAYMTDMTSRQTEITSDHKPWTATNTRAPAVPKSVTHCIELSKNRIFSCRWPTFTLIEVDRKVGGIIESAKGKRGSCTGYALEGREK